MTRCSLLLVALCCLAATTITQTAPVVPLAWDANPADLPMIDGYRVERRAGAAVDWQVLTPSLLPPTAARYSDTTVTNGASYCYRVAQVASGGLVIQYAIVKDTESQTELCITLPLTIHPPTGFRVEPLPVDPPPVLPTLGPELMPNWSMEAYEWGRWPSDGTMPTFTWTSEAYAGKKAIEISAGASTTRVRGGYGSAFVPIDATQRYQISVARTYAGVQQMRILALWRTASDGEVSTTVLEEHTAQEGGVVSSTGWVVTPVSVGPYAAVPIGGLRIHLYCTIVPIPLALIQQPLLTPPLVDTLLPLPMPQALGSPSQYCRWDEVSVRQVLDATTR